MNQEIKKQWVAALRSGEYKQGYGKLKRDDCFCVWGVLCDLFGKENKAFGWEDYYFPTNHVLVWADVSNRAVVYQLKTSDLYYFNDGIKLPFSELADLIEKQF